MSEYRQRTQRWYKNSRWEKRARAQLREHPLCCMCLQDGVVREARVADHIIPHRGDYNSFWLGKLQSLCVEHHNASKHEIEIKGFVTDIDANGFPADSRHPFNQVK